MDAVVKQAVAERAVDDAWPVIADLNGEAYHAVEQDDYRVAHDSSWERASQRQRDVIKTYFPAFHDAATDYQAALDDLGDYMDDLPRYGAVVSAVLPADMVDVRNVNGQEEITLDGGDARVRFPSWVGACYDRDARDGDDIRATATGTVPDITAYWDRQYPEWADDMHALLDAPHDIDGHDVDIGLVATEQVQKEQDVSRAASAVRNAFGDILADAVADGSVRERIGDIVERYG